MVTEYKINWANENYTASWGTFKYVGDAETVAKEIESIGNSVTRRQIVDYAAEHTDSELNKCFEWDNNIAADRYRIQQAGAVISNLKITIIHEDKTPEITPIRYFSMPQKKNGGYEKTEVVVQNIDKYSLLLSKAKNELRAFEVKYKMLSEMEDVFKAIHAL